jgi:hypothetical protein
LPAEDARCPDAAEGNSTLADARHNWREISDYNWIAQLVDFRLRAGWRKATTTTTTKKKKT